MVSLIVFSEFFFPEVVFLNWASRQPMARVRFLEKSTKTLSNFQARKICHAGGENWSNMASEEDVKDDENLLPIAFGCFCSFWMCFACFLDVLDVFGRFLRCVFHCRVFLGTGLMLLQLDSRDEQLVRVRAEDESWSIHLVLLFGMIFFQGSFLQIQDPSEVHWGGSDKSL